MATYLHPGVYIEEIPSGAKPIEAVGTSTAAFIGYTTKGPIGKPELIFKWDDYNTVYGGLRDVGTGVKEGDPMGFSVRAFFQNGGTAAYIVRLVKEMDVLDADKAVKASGTMDHPSPANATHGLIFTAVNEGAWANGLVVQVTEKGIDNLYTVEIGREDEEGKFSAQESFSDVSMTEGDAQYIEGAINGVSELVTVKLLALDDVDFTLPRDYYLGTSTSGDLSSADLAVGRIELNLTDLTKDERKLTLSIDGNEFTITIDNLDFAKDLKALADKIQTLVRTGVTTERRANFTCVVKNNALVLVSGTREATSAVVVKHDCALAPTLKLGVLNDLGAVEKTGAETAADAGAGTYTALAVGKETTLVSGADGNEPGSLDYTSVFTDFLKYRDINIICLPGQNWPKDMAVDTEGKPVIDAAISHAEKMTNRMVIVDPPPTYELTKELDVIGLSLPTSTYSVLYYPWLKVTNPFYDAETNPGAYKALLVPPSGTAAGMWSKIDSRRGVWKAPAGVETGLLGVAGLQWVVEDDEQNQLNPLAVNAIRKQPGFGPVIWGARTLSTKANPEWRYVPVRRTAIFIEQSIYGGIQWAVFEPNDHRLWASLRANIDSFMNGLFRAGAFQGEKASEAYFVRCGLGDTMTQGDIDRGQVIAIVGFAPLKPAEFVIIRIQQKAGQNQ